MITHATQNNHPTHFFDLCHLLKQLLRSWDINQFEGLSRTENPDRVLPVQRLVRLTGTLRGTLLFSCSTEFPGWLRNRRNYSVPNFYTEDEILEELVSMYCLHLFHHFWDPDSFQIGPIQPLPGSPENQPVSSPDAVCHLLVEGHPVETRLWLNP